MTHIVDFYRTTPLLEIGLSTQVSVQSSDAVEVVVRTMAAASTSCAFVMEQDALVGIFTEHDIAMKVALHPDLWGVPIAQVMTPDPFKLHSDQTALEALQLMNQHRFRNLPVIEGDRLVGNMTHYDLIRAASNYLRANPGDDQELMASHSLRFINFLGIALDEPITVTPDVSLAEVVELMIIHKKGLVSVLGPRGTIVGEFSEHDLLENVACRVEALEDEAVGDWMTTNIASTDIRSSIADGIHLMAEKRHRYLVLVTETDRPLSVATFRDISEYLESVMSAS